jgi:hypothetical protein
MTDHDPPILVQGCFEEGSPGWGYVNHSSNVDFEDNVAYDNFGAGFAAEAGNEIGTFNNDYSVRAQGLPTSGGSPTTVGPANLSDTSSLGVNGHGFWLQSPAVTVTNDVATDCETGFSEWNLGLVEKNLGEAQLYTAWLPNGGYSRTYLTPDNVQLSGFSNDTASFINGSGLTTSWLNQGSNNGLFSTVNNFTASDVRYGVFGEKYTHRLTLRDSTFVAAPGGVIGVNMVSNYAPGWTLTNDTVNGFATGVAIPGRGTITIDGGSYDDATAFSLDHGMSGTVVDFTGPIAFGPSVRTRYQLRAAAPPWNDRGPTIVGMFSPEQVFLPDGSELYWPTQAASAVPFPAQVGSGANSIPPQLIGLTSQQLSDQYGLTPQGALAPASATTPAWTNGLVGPPQTPPSVYGLKRPLSAPVSAPYTLQYKVFTGFSRSAVYTYPTPFNLQAGWNAISVILNGQQTTFFVFGIAPSPSPGPQPGPAPGMPGMMPSPSPGPAPVMSAMMGP